MPTLTRPITLLRIALCCSGALLLGACSNGGTPADNASAGAAPPPNLCTDPRPEICTQEYIGVCATLSDGSTRTAATGCTACADPDVVGWRLGECD
ncbi:MAG: hypothetical protein AB7I04_06890 [Pseudomonadales bacterium]